VDVADVERALDATREVGSAVGLAVDEATVICNSNKLALRLLPCDVFARVAFAGQEAFAFEIEIARRLSQYGSPVASLDTRVDPRVYQRERIRLHALAVLRAVGDQPLSRRLRDGT